MVFFTCDKCAEALKKNQVEKHNYKCRFPTYSCIDCNTVFDANSYKDHVKCITEDQKYGGKNYVAKENKGELKQNQWVEQVERAIANVENPKVKQLLKQIQGFGNIPRKEAKFVNFLQNSIRIRDRNLCLEAWNCISEEARKMNEQACGAKTETSAKNNEVFSEKNDVANCSNSASVAESPDGVKQNCLSTSEQEETAAKKAFKWKKAIKRALKDTESGSMKVKRLRKTVFKMFEAAGFQVDENELKELFASKLNSSGITVSGKIAQLS